MSVTWKGLHLEKLLGDEYRKHEHIFSESIASFTSIPFTSNGAYMYSSESFGYNQRVKYSCLQLVCSGFDFIDSYNVKKNCYNNSYKQ
jgi:hypothetical protein